MYILGLGGSLHDFSACLLENSNILTVIEDERITRNKHGKNLGIKLANGYSKNYCLRVNGIDMSKISLTVANDIINPCMLYKMNNVFKINHHLAHAASSYYCSPYDEAAILVIDSVGSKVNAQQYETISYYYGKGNEIQLLDRCTGINLKDTEYITNSLGIFYSLITELIGFSELEEGKTMGLAPYGSDSQLKKLMSYVDFENGHFRLSVESIKHIIEQKNKNKEKNFQLMSDYAWAAQKILEEALLNCCIHLRQLTKSENLCLAGGVFLNSVANYKLYKKSIFRNIFIQPAAGDNGTSIGAALYGYHNLLNNN